MTTRRVEMERSAPGSRPSENPPRELRVRAREIAEDVEMSLGAAQLKWSAVRSSEFFNQHYLDYVGLAARQPRDWRWTTAIPTHRSLAPSRPAGGARRATSHREGGFRNDPERPRTRGLCAAEKNLFPV
jgi:hypothetical protein